MSIKLKHVYPLQNNFPFTSRIKPIILPTRVVNLKGKLQTINETDLVDFESTSFHAPYYEGKTQLRSTCQFDHVSTDSWYLIIPEQLTSANPELQRKEREMSAQLPKKQNTNVILDMENTKSSTKWIKKTFFYIKFVLAQVGKDTLSCVCKMGNDI